MITLILMGLGAPLLYAASATTPSAPCEVTGTVRDHEGQPVVGVDVGLQEGASPRRTTTDAAGQFRFAAVPDPTLVIVTLREGGKAPRFEIVANNVPVTMVTKVDPAHGCEVDLRPTAGEPLADRFALYQGIRRGFQLIEELGIDSEIVLRIEVDDAVASPHAAYWTGPPSFNPADTQPVRIVLGTEASRANDPGAPDNREYHELGHHALALAFGALPRARDNIDGGGYHQNPSSAEAWTEGFAIFFASMVAREIDERTAPGHYRVAGAKLDLELDYQPWDLRGLESVAVASLLWDLVDGAPQTQASPLEIRTPSVRTDAGVPYLLIGRVHNPSASPVLDARVQVSTESWRGTTPVAPARLRPGADGWFAIPLPTALGELSDPLAALTLEATPIPGTDDDDPLTLTLAQLWTAIAELRSEHPQSNGRLFDVSDLYRALRGRFGAEIDPLFVAHGLFADLDGDRQRSPSEPLGLTSHPGREIMVDGTLRTWPAMDPRRRVALPASLQIQADVQPSHAQLVVVVSGSRWGGYLVELDDERRFHLIPPPAAEGATVSVIAMAPDLRPTVLLHRDAVELLAEIEGRNAPYLVLMAELPPLSSETIASSPSRWPRFVFAGGAIATFLGLILMAIGWPRHR